jgi:threonine dehydrogenase-like Zn-dependent dehydrogenase
MTAARTMRALQLSAVNRLEEVRRPVPVPRPDELLVRTVATTICTSDLNDIAHNPFEIALPRVLGHEGAGVVEAVGEQVAGFNPGDPIAAHPVIPCGSCDNCERGLGHLCERMGHLGLDRDGTFAEFFCIRADRARVVAEYALRYGSLLEPVAVCLEAVQRGRIAPGDNVLVAGDGPFGIIIGRLASRRCRPGKVIVAGRHDFRLRQVAEAITVNENVTPDVLTAVRQASGHAGVDVAIMAAGTQSALDLCLGSLRARGRAVIFSAIPGQARVDLFRVHTQELDILGACNDQAMIDEALVCLDDPELGLASLVTHRLPFAEWPRAFELARGRKDEALKVALVFDA